MSFHTATQLPILDPIQVPPTRSLWGEVFSHQSWASIVGSKATRATTSYYTPVWMFGCLMLEINLLWIWAGFLPVEFTVAQFIALRLLYNGGMGFLLMRTDKVEEGGDALSAKPTLQRSTPALFPPVAQGTPSVVGLMQRLIAHFHRRNPRALNRVFQSSILDHSTFKKEGLGSGQDLTFTPGGSAHLHNNVQAWLMFRIIFGPVLAMDLVAYFVMCMAYVDWVEFFDVFSLTAPGIVSLRYLVGLLLILLGLWVKRSADGVLGTYGWFMGDFFFLLPQARRRIPKGPTNHNHLDAKGTVKTNGIFAVFPHPMYTVGYSFYYGFTLITGSGTVLVVSLAAHLFGQLGFFLRLAEIPHMNRVYA